MVKKYKKKVKKLYKGGIISDNTSVVRHKPNIKLANTEHKPIKLPSPQILTETGDRLETPLTEAQRMDRAYNNMQATEPTPNQRFMYPNITNDKLAAKEANKHGSQLGNAMIDALPIGEIGKLGRINKIGNTNKIAKTNKIYNTFKSEINWNKFNKEIPDNKQLLDEYYTIEKTNKANGTWMKNSDGSIFDGTPEQFVQQQSSNFKKAFGNSKLVNKDGSPIVQYHGSAKKFDTFDESKFQLGDSGYSGRGIYTTPSKNKASSYALSSKSIHNGDYTPTVYELYGQGNNPISAEDLIKQNKDYDLFNFHRSKNFKGDVPIEQQLLDYDVAIRNQTRGIEKSSSLE
jgi:hypothetical protein